MRPTRTSPFPPEGPHEAKRTGPSAPTTASYVLCLQTRLRAPVQPQLRPGNNEKSEYKRKDHNQPGEAPKHIADAIPQGQVSHMIVTLAQPVGAELLSMQHAHRFTDVPRHGRLPEGRRKGADRIIVAEGNRHHRPVRLPGRFNPL